MSLALDLNDPALDLTDPALETVGLPEGSVFLGLSGAVPGLVSLALGLRSVGSVLGMSHGAARLAMARVRGGLLRGRHVGSLNMNS
jgi:hypothetical protein